MIVFALIAMLRSGLPLAAEPIGDPANWIVASDIPRSEWSRATITSYDLMLDSAGKLVSCVITNQSGSDIIDGIVCNSLMKRAHYKPARDSAGNAVPSAIRDHVQWHPNAFGFNHYFRDIPDIVISDSAATSKMGFNLVKVIETVSSSDIVESCEVYQSSKIEKLDGKACAVVSLPEVSKVILDASNRPTRGIRAFNVGFIAGANEQILVR